MRLLRHVMALALLAVLAGCATDAGAPTGGPSDSSRPTRSAPATGDVPPSEEPMTGEVPPEIMADLLADAAQRSDVAEDALSVLRAEATTWNDGSLGCPERGMSYTMALVEGYHVVLEAGDEEIDYRVTRDGAFRVCESGGRPGG